MPQDTRTCTRCEESKPVADFKRAKQRKDGISSWCRECHNFNQRRWYQANHSRALNRNRENWWKNHAVQFSLWKLEGTTSGLCSEYLRALYRDPCAYCGAPAEHADHIFAARRTKENHKERVKPTEWDDLTAACQRCNQTKGTQSLVEFLGWPTGWLRR